MFITKFLKLRTMVILLLVLLQLIFNQLIPNKIDIIGTLALIVLVNQYANYPRVFLLSIIADLIGPYYIGTHFFALLLISFLSQRYYNFYKILTYIQRNIILIIYILIYQLIINLLKLILTNHFSYIAFVISSIIILPLIFIVSTIIYRKNYNKDNIYL